MFFSVFFIVVFISLFFVNTFFGNQAFLKWNILFVVVLPFVLLFSISYFSRRDFSYKKLRTVHLLASIVFLGAVIGGRLVEFREQEEVLIRYQSLVQSIKNHDQDAVNEILLPTYRDSFYETTNVWLFMSIDDAPNLSPHAVSVNLFNNEAFINPDPRISRWYHPICGYFVEMKKYQGEWYYAGRGGLASC